MSKKDVNFVLSEFQLDRHAQAFKTPKQFRELRASEYHLFGITEAEEVLRLRDAISQFNERFPPLSPGSSAVSGVGRGADDDGEDDGNTTTNHNNSSRSCYTARGTTVLTHTEADGEVKQKSRIVVAIRKRPLSRIEISNGFEDVMECDNASEIVLREPKVKVDLRKYTHVHRFYLDESFDEQCSNEDVYNRTARALIDTVFEGGSATCFAYGQTGSGKTHTMLGSGDEPGLYALAAKEMFDRLDTSVSLTVSFYEIYSGKLYDLLNGRRLLRCLEDERHNVNIRGLTEHVSANVCDVMQIIERGSRNRSSGCTGANDTSSRSHAILEIRLRRNGEEKSGGKFTFIDLAGSERGADTLDCARQTRREGAEINKSLLALKECIRSLDMNKKHVPFRGSKLTEVLRDSFIGNCRTVMIGAVSPSNGNCEDTLNTLRYADRVKELKKNPSTRRTQGGSELSELVFEKSESGRPSLAAPERRSPSSVAAQDLHAAPRRSGALRPSVRANLPPTVPKQTLPRSVSPRASVCFDKDLKEAPARRGQKRKREEGEGEEMEVEAERGEKRDAGAQPAPVAPPRADWSELIAGQRRRTVEHLSQYLEADMNCIKEEYQLKYDVEQSTSTNSEFVTRAKVLLDLKMDAIRSFSYQVDQLEKMLLHSS